MVVACSECDRGAARPEIDEWQCLHFTCVVAARGRVNGSERIPELAVGIVAPALDATIREASAVVQNPLASFLPVLNDHVAAAIGLLEISRMAVVSATV